MTLNQALQSLTQAVSYKDILTGTKAVSQIINTPNTVEKIQPRGAIIPSIPPHPRTDIPTTQSTRQKANNQAIALLDEINQNSLTRNDLTTEQLDALARYTGNGGGITGKDGKRGSAYEYYTPIEVASSMWDLAKELGFNGGKVLDPCAGTGIFTAISPDNAIVDSIELDETSGAIAKILNDGERSHTTIAPFESQANRIEDDSLDMVMTNVPFGDKKARGANRLLDKAYQNESLENYFILRSLEKVKPSGLAIFITPTQVVSSPKKQYENLRTKASLKAEFLGSYRLPNSVFKQTGADVVTDVVVFKRHSREALDMINDLYESGDLTTLADTNVLWQEFVDGQYFKQTGKRFVLGELQKVKDTRWGGLKEEVVNTKPTSEVAKMMKKFDGSRIDWQALNTSEPSDISYQNGDTLFQNGKQLTYQDGIFIEVEQDEHSDDMRDFLALIANLNGGAVSIVEHGISYKQAKEAKDYAEQTGQRTLLDDDVLTWLQQAQYSGTDNVAWQTLTLAKAIEQTISEHGYEYNYVDYEPKITEAMKPTYLDGKNSKLSGQAGQAHKLIKLHYANGKYSKVWRGDVDTEITDTGDNLAKLQYQNGSLFVSREQFDSLNPDIDPLNNDDWFVNADGEVIHVDDYLVGSLKNRLADIDNQIEQADDEAVKIKLIKQKAIARDKAYRLDIRNMEFDLRTPLISAENKVQFLRQHVHPSAIVVYDEYNKGTPDIDIKGARYDKDKLYNRFGDWLQKGTVSLGGIKIEMSDREALNWLSDEINRANTIFNTWVKANHVLMEQIKTQVNHEDNLYFPQNSNDSPIEIDGMNTELSLHGYQNEFVRGQGRSFGGVNGLGVGLGKTFSSLASVQHVHNIGVKKKTLFVVPNSVLSNWRKETLFAYQNTDDCLFVGLREKGDNFKVHSSKYDEDLLEAVSSQHRKIFITFEAFRRIRLKEQTIEGYANYLRNTDKAYAHKKLKAKDEKTKGMVAELMETIDIDSNAPYLEDMGVDSVVIDEAHAFKNSITAPETDSNVKYLSLATTSKRGEDAQAKLWYIRGLTADNDGVQLLTATPITNSPLEVYSMLSLTKGRDAVNAMAGGINGADDFISVMCRIGEEVVQGIDGSDRSVNVFQSLRNLDVLRNTINNTATIKGAKDVGMSVVIPEREEVATPVTLPSEVIDDLKLHQLAYSQARAMEKGEAMSEQVLLDPNSAFNLIQQRYGEKSSLIAHPFNLIRKMDIIASDSEFADTASWYDFDPSQRAIANKVVKTYNAKKLKEERGRMGAYTTEDRATPKYNNEGSAVSYQVTTLAKLVLDGGCERIVIDTMNYKNQQAFEAIADKQGLKLNISVSPKLSAMLDNFKSELANPRGLQTHGERTNLVKQIIFCDQLHLHSKIKRILVDKTAIKANKITIITGQTNNEPDKMIDIQDGFNAFSEDNQYQVIIANKKAEVGINLQHGTQAIHHLTTGWTPDSLEQRNGRGARQGNMTSSVRIYQYDAYGTFDEFKRTMINKKGDWIASVLSNHDKQNVAISGGLSDSEKQALIDSMGDKQAMEKYLSDKDKQQQIGREQLAQRRQSISLDLIKTQANKIKELTVNDFYLAEMKTVVKVIRENIKNRNNMSKPDRKPHLIEKDTQKYNAQKKVAIRLLEHIISSVELVKSEGWGENAKVIEQNSIEMTADEVYQKIETNYKDFKPSDENFRGWKDNFVRMVGGGYSHYVEVITDSDYHADYDEAINTAKNLIKQSAKSINEIADEVGTDKLPDNAGEKIINGEAIVNAGGVYIEKGMIVSNDGVLGVITDELRTYRLKDDGYKTNHAINQDSTIITTNTKDYLDYVKLLAKREDELYASRSLKESIYSDTIPLVAEYRDGDVKPNYKLNPNKRYLYHLSNAKLPILLPLGLFEDGDSNFARQLNQAYVESGIQIDFANNTFQITNDNVEVAEEYTFPSEISPIIMDFVKVHAIELSEFDVIAIEALGYDISSLAIAGEIKQSQDEPTNNDLQPTDLVEVTGNTRSWKEEIKAYAKKHGKTFETMYHRRKRQSYYKWHGSLECWVVYYGAFQQLIADHPQANKELTIEKSEVYS